MAKPTEKSESIETFLDGFTANAFGRTRTDSISTDVCVMCGKPAIEFRDALSRKEFTISGMCQECQDSIFG